MPDDLHQEILDTLDSAGARVGKSTHITTAGLADRLDVDRAAVEQALATLRFDEQRVLKGPRVGDAGSQWRIEDRDDDADHLAVDD
jgi:hypothetical protein